MSKERDNQSPAKERDKRIGEVIVSILCDWEQYLEVHGCLMFHERDADSYPASDSPVDYAEKQVLCRESPAPLSNAGELCYVDRSLGETHDGASSSGRGRWSCNRDGSGAKLGAKVVISVDGVNRNSKGRQKLE